MVQSLSRYRKTQEKVFADEKIISAISAYFYGLIYYKVADRLQTDGTYTEESLVIALKQYDSAAYRHLYMHYRGAMYNVILQLVPDPETANDVLQETFTTIWQQIDKYDMNKGRLFTWLIKITRNMAINKLRSKIYKSQSRNETLDNYVSSIENGHESVDVVNYIGLRQQVHRLKEDYKNVIELSYYNGFTQEEIAKALKIPVGTVKTRLRNALLELRKQFD